MNISTFVRTALVAVFLALFAGGCASNKNIERAEDAGRIGCNFVPFAGICKEGIRQMVERRRDDMYQVLGLAALTAPQGQMQAWSYKDDAGFMVVHSRTQGDLDDLGTFYVIDITYFHITDGGVENVTELTLLAIPNPDASRVDQPAYIYLWR